MIKVLILTSLFLYSAAHALQWNPEPPKLANALVGYSYRTCLSRHVKSASKEPLRFEIANLPKWVTLEDGCLKGRPTYVDYGAVRLRMKVTQGEKVAETRAYLFVFDGND